MEESEEFRIMERDLPNYKIYDKKARGLFWQCYDGEAIDGKKVVIKKTDLTDLAKEAMRLSGFSNKKEWCEAENKMGGQVRSVESDNIAKMLHIGMGGVTGDFYRVAEPYDETLEDILKKEGKIKTNQAKEWLWQISQALRDAEEQQSVVHKDLKPGNIGVKNGIIKLDDWGCLNTMSMAYDEEGKRDLTSLSTIAPETVMSGKVTKQSNKWSMGVMLYEMTTGKKFYNERFPADLKEDELRDYLLALHKKCQDSEFIQNRVKQIPRQLRKIAKKLLVFDPEKRYCNYEKLQKDIEKAGKIPKKWKYLGGTAVLGLLSFLGICNREPIYEASQNLFYKTVGIVAPEKLKKMKSATFLVEQEFNSRLAKLTNFGKIKFEDFITKRIYDYTHIADLTLYDTLTLEEHMADVDEEIEQMLRNAEGENYFEELKRDLEEMRTDKKKWFLTKKDERRVLDNKKFLEKIEYANTDIAVITKHLGILTKEKIGTDVNTKITDFKALNKCYFDIDISWTSDNIKIGTMNFIGEGTYSEKLENMLSLDSDFSIREVSLNTQGKGSYLSLNEFLLQASKKYRIENFFVAVKEKYHPDERNGVKYVIDKQGLLEHPEFHNPAACHAEVIDDALFFYNHTVVMAGIKEYKNGKLVKVAQDIFGYSLKDGIWIPGQVLALDYDEKIKPPVKEKTLARKMKDYFGKILNSEYELEMELTEFLEGYLNGTVRPNKFTKSLSKLMRNEDSKLSDALYLERHFFDNLPRHLAEGMSKEEYNQQVRKVLEERDPYFIQSLEGVYNLNILCTVLSRNFGEKITVKPSASVLLDDADSFFGDMAFIGIDFNFCKDSGKEVGDLGIIYLGDKIKDVSELYNLDVSDELIRFGVGSKLITSTDSFLHQATLGVREEKLFDFVKQNYLKKGAKVNIKALRKTPLSYELENYNDKGAFVKKGVLIFDNYSDAVLGIEKKKGGKATYRGVILHYYPISRPGWYEAPKRGIQDKKPLVELLE